MIERFLRLFRAYRELEETASFGCDESARLQSEIEKLENERIRLEGLLIAKQGEIDRVWEDSRRNAAAAEHTYQMLANFGMQRSFGVTPFPNAVRLPDRVTPAGFEEDPGGPVEAPYEQGVTMVARGTRDFMKRAYELAGLTPKEDEAA